MSALTIHPCSSITTGPSPPVSRRNSSPRPGICSVSPGGSWKGGSGGQAEERTAGILVRRQSAKGLNRAPGHRRSAADHRPERIWPSHGAHRFLPWGLMAVVIASDLGKDIAGELLLRGISFKLERRDRMTLSGRNGAGKTTLLRMLAGEASVDSGELVLAKGAKVALHDQRPPRDRGLTLRDYVLSGAPELVAIEQQLASLEQAMADGAHDETTLNRYAEAQARLEHAGGYDWRDRALSTLRGLGFRAGSDLDRSLEAFSGGELTRASLGRALAGDPDLLLLDEPTNHLDIASLEWLEQHLVSLDAAIVLVAHDRWFLEAVGTAVLELEAGRGRFFPGTWHAWRREKAARELALGRAVERQQAEIERLERFVTRFRAGTRATCTPPSAPPKSAAPAQKTRPPSWESWSAAVKFALRLFRTGRKRRYRRKSESTSKPDRPSTPMP